MEPIKNPSGRFSIQCHSLTRRLMKEKGIARADIPAMFQAKMGCSVAQFLNEAIIAILKEEA